ncbi:putative DNA-binding protein (MmcQ/YjbR family) [Paenibacillus castaneae]|uniref:MmcQ/YjbR family DNA-binding protein n=1 Tax=Paenibacillus castaneae TaxID=474957 RepID=UPI000C9B012B|nr:MmcQ/YjbR family DNA-binding protein [Paenibacillus castaneae]NIK76465.1 putative DNA-binding protein (MmcQ/YjbR family) [Paenibacillus castaneae]
MVDNVSGIKTAMGIQMLEQVRLKVKDLPEVIELIDGHGHTTFKVKDKSFIMMSDYGITFKSDLENQEILLQQEQFFKPAYIGHRGWVSIHNPKDWDEMGVLLKEAYMRAAPKRLLKLFM